MNKLLRCILVVSMLGAQFPVMSKVQASESESSENSFVSEGTDQSLEETESKSQEELVDASDEDRYTESSENPQDTIVSSEQSSKEEETTMSSDPLIQDEDDLDHHDGTPNREATSIASGTFGTSAWYITEEGVLHIGAGRFGVSAINNGPWWGYRTTITKITFDGPVVANANSSYLFQSLSATEIEGLENLDTSSVTNMEGLFRSAKINNLDLSSFNTSRVTNMASMFNSMSELKSIDLSGFDTRNVTLMNSMFMSTSLTSLNLSNFDTSKVTRIQQMFDGSRNLAELVGAENWDTSNVVDMGFLFRSTAFSNLDLTDWNVSRVSNMQQMFSGMTRLNSLDISSWNTASLTVFPNIFASTTNLSELKLGENSLFSRNNANTGLPNINRSGFSGRWVGQNMKNVYNNSAQFMSTYDGSFPDTYVWEASAGDVIVRYVDQEGNALVSEVTLSGFLGDSYESEPREISGWHIVETPSNASGAFTEEAQEVIYVYDRSDAAPVTVRYVDTEGNQLSEPSILSGKVGLPYESEAKEIPGWYVVETPDNASGTFTEDPQEVVYVYDRSDAAPITVRYEDAEGNQLSEPNILSGKVGLPYESEAKEIPGWYVVETPDNASGTFTEDPQEVVYVYDRSDAAPITVRYEDAEGNQLSEPNILSGKVGLPYESEAKEIPGWYVVETPDNASGTFTEDPQEVVYVYDRSDAAPVTVRYLDTEGNQLSEPSILSGKVGLPYESEAKEIRDWYVTETPDNASGTFTEEPQEVVYIYAINKIDSEQDNSDNNLPTDNNFSDSHKRLPDTGESLIGQLSMILAGLLIVIGIFVFLVRRRNNKD